MFMLVPRAAKPLDEIWPEETDEEVEFRLQLTKALGHCDLRLIKRVVRLEEENQDLKEVIKLLSSRIEILEKAAQEKPEVYKNVTEGRILELRKKILGMPRRNGIVYLDSLETRHFLEFEIREDLRLIGVKNPSDRTTKTMKELQNQYPKEFKITKAIHFNNKLRLTAIL